MITVEISGSKMEFGNSREIDENWINEQVNRRRQEGQTVCVRVIVHEEPVNLLLTSLECPKTSGSGYPNSEEQKIIDLWDQVGMNRMEFHGGNLVAFLKQLHRFLR